MKTLKNFMKAAFRLVKPPKFSAKETQSLILTGHEVAGDRTYAMRDGKAIRPR